MGVIGNIFKDTIFDQRREDAEATERAKNIHEYIIRFEVNAGKGTLGADKDGIAKSEAHYAGANAREAKEKFEKDFKDIHDYKIDMILMVCEGWNGTDCKD